MACYAYEDLHAVFARMDKVLPGRDGSGVSCVAPAEGWGWRSMVIEAKPLCVEVLDTEDWDAWRLREEIPDKHQNTQGRRWYITQSTRCSPRGKEACITGLKGMNLPHGASLWHAPDDARRLLCLARHDAQMLFEALPDLHLPRHEGMQGVLTLFSTPGPAELCFADSVRLLRPHAPYLARLAEEYARGLSWMFGLQGQDFEEGCRMHLTWSGSDGKTIELPPASPCRFENGPIVHVGLGRPVVEHDLAPTIRDPSGGLEWPVRVGVAEGVMLCLDGASRIRYAHGLPQKTGSQWLLFTFMLDCNRRSTAVAYERETRAVIMQTPVLSERVVRTCKPANEGDVPADRGDAISSLVRNMRRRLRVAESHMIAARYQPRTGSIGMTENSSSSSVLA